MNEFKNMIRRVEAQAGENTLVSDDNSIVFK